MSEEERPPGSGFGDSDKARRPSKDEIIVAAANDILGDGRALMPAELAVEIAKKLELNPEEAKEIENLLNSDDVLEMLSDNNIGLDDMYQFVKTKPRKGPYQHIPSAMDLTDYTKFRRNPSMPDLREVIKQELEEALSDAERREIAKFFPGRKITSQADVDKRRKEIEQAREKRAQEPKTPLHPSLDEPSDPEKLRAMLRPSN